MSPRARAATAAAVLSLTLAGCGGTVASTGGGSASGSDTGSASGSTTRSASGSAPAEAISVDTAKGTVELPAPATRVVSLEWTYTEELLALGVTPVGVADGENYAQWVTAEGAEIPEGVAEVGTRQEPSIEQIRALQPDLIVSDTDRLTANYEQLQQIAPVLAFDPTEQPAVQTMRDDFEGLALAVGKAEQAEEMLAELDAKTEEVQDRLAEAGKEKAAFALSQGYTVEGTPGIRMFTDESLAGALVAQTGLRNGWTGKPDAWGMTTVGVEGLTRVAEDATFLYVALEEDDPFAGVLADNPAWQQLSFVEQDRVRALDPGTWLFGGPLSAMQLLEETALAFGA